MPRIVKMLLLVLAAIVGWAWYDGRLPNAINSILGRGSQHKENYSEFEREAGLGSGEEDR